MCHQDQQVSFCIASYKFGEAAIAVGQAQFFHKVRSAQGAGAAAVTV